MDKSRHNKDPCDKAEEYDGSGAVSDSDHLSDKANQDCNHDQTVQHWQKSSNS